MKSSQVVPVASPLPLTREQASQPPALKQLEGHPLVWSTVPSPSCPTGTQEQKTVRPGHREGSHMSWHHCSQTAEGRSVCWLLSGTERPFRIYSKLSTVIPAGSGQGAKTGSPTAIPHASTLAVGAFLPELTPS